MWENLYNDERLDSPKHVDIDLQSLALQLLHNGIGLRWHHLAQSSDFHYWIDKKIFVTTFSRKTEYVAANQWKAFICMAERMDKTILVEGQAGCVQLPEWWPTFPQNERTLTLQSPAVGAPETPATTFPSPHIAVPPAVVFCSRSITCRQQCDVKSLVYESEYRRNYCSNEVHATSSLLHPLWVEFSPSNFLDIGHSETPDLCSTKGSRHGHAKKRNRQLFPLSFQESSRRNENSRK